MPRNETVHESVTPAPGLDTADDSTAVSPPRPAAATQATAAVATAAVATAAVAVPTALTGGGVIDVYTDGACSNNGSRQARAGVGVFFGPQDPRNVSETLEGSTQTNQRAEMTV